MCKLENPINTISCPTIQLYSNVTDVEKWVVILESNKRAHCKPCPVHWIHNITMTLHCSIKLIRDQVCGHGKKLRHVQSSVHCAMRIHKTGC